ncbi:MAG: HEPN family nuclease [Georgfuchsia sp.]
MEYDKKFTRSFMQRTLTLARNYSGSLDATLLINCLVGLLIVPKETLIERIPATDFESLKDWGINPSSIKKVGRCEYGHEHRPNLRQLVRRLRNAVAHFRIEPHHNAGNVVGFSFRDKNGFHAEISLDEISTFVTKLAEYLEAQA